MSYIILDLDNTIADDSWRIPKINWQKAAPEERYHDYHTLSSFDAVGNKDLLSTDHEIIIFTARPVIYRAITEEWLARKNIHCKYLLMRNRGDHRHSVDLKRQMLHWMPALYDIDFEDVVCAYDDRQDVVDMFKSFGIQAQRRWIHDVCAYTNPNKETA